MLGARRPILRPAQDRLGGGVLFAVRWSESGERNEADEPFSSALWMHRFEEPFRGYFPPNSRFSCTRQNLTPNRRELQSKTDIVAEATYRIVFRSAGMFTVNELR
jgi:hypothetical protein